MVLDGLSQHTFEFVDGLTQDAAGHASLTSSMLKSIKLLKTANAAVVATVCVCNAVGLTANSVAAYFFSNGADLEAKAARKYGRGDTDANQTLSEASKAFTSGNAANSVQNYSEALVLNLVLLVFLAAVLSATRVLRVADGMAQDIIKASQRQANFQLVRDAAAAAAAGARMRRRIMATVGVCFVSFFFRAIWSVLVAISQSSYDYNPQCGEYPTGQCSPCQPVGVAIRFTLFFTPEVQVLVELVSSPLALCFALWGMTSDRDRKELNGTQQVLHNLL
jgi:hypothetical protein